MSADARGQPLTDDVRTKLKEHFNVPLEQYSGRWDSLWEKGDFLPWDRGLPNPALVDTLKDKKDLIGEPLADGRRKRALVPGCGKGYDVLFLAGLGYDAYGLEISENALKQCRDFAEQNFSDYAKKDVTPGEYKFILGDFFKDDWLEEAGGRSAGFDLIYDYTFLCALPFELRPAWAARTSELLAPESQGRLICLEFPTFKPPSTGGPPFGVTPAVYVAHLTNPGETLPYTSEWYPEETTYSKEAVEHTRNGLGLERIAHWQPERTHEVGQGTDWVSIWKHKPL